MQIKTTNPCEGFHSGSRERFVGAKTHLLRFISMLRDQREATRVKYEEIITGTVVKKTPKTTYKRYWAIKQAVLKLEKVLPMDYLRGIASRVHLPKPDDGAADA